MRKRSRGEDCTREKTCEPQSLLDCRLCCLEARSQSSLDAAELFLCHFVQKCSKKKAKETLAQASKKSHDPNPNHRMENLSTARDWLAMLYLQSGRPNEAAPLLKAGGYAVRLSSAVLNNRLLPGLEQAAKDLPCVAVDNALSRSAQAVICRALGPLEADYWTSHKYSVEPPTPYFSYVLQLACAKDLGALGMLIETVYAVGCRSFGDAVKKAKFVEIWAHNRPHGSGHQLHFDSDDEGRGGIRHPLVSSAYFVQGSVGGPTLVSTQRLGDKFLGESCWLCPPESNRLVVFDGSVLHGVLPGRGVSPEPKSRRVTLMIALWADITVRDEAGHGSARKFPTGANVPQWVRDLTNTADQSGADQKLQEVVPVFVERLWEAADGSGWPRNRPIPPYDSVFQGF
jgi:hypothetical protein